MNEPSSALVAAAAQGAAGDALQGSDALQRSRAFAEPLIAGESLETGENTLAHADAVAQILAQMGASPAMQASSYLVYACPHLNRPQEVIAKAFGESFATLAVETNQLVRVQQQERSAEATALLADDPKLQTEKVRKMLLAFSRDVRVVMLRLASRLQTLRHCAAVSSQTPLRRPQM
ncbi:MAG: HD domain-containing protein, partial [Burkholderiaceae bacterium]